MAALRDTRPGTPTPQIKKITFDGWRFAHYFDFVTRDQKNLKVKCKLCPGRKILSSALNTTSNLLKHLQTQHNNTTLVAAGDKDQPDNNGPTPSKQQKLDFEKPKEISKSEVNRLSASYIVEEVLPLSTVESPSFRKLVGQINIIGDARPITDRKTFTNYLDNCYKKMESDLKQTFESVEYVS